MENKTNCDKLGFGEDNEAAVVAIAATTSFTFHYIFNAAMELDLFTIIANAAGGDGDCRQISPSEIASCLPIRRHKGEATTVLDCMLRLLACHSLLTCSMSAAASGGRSERRYGLAPSGKFFVRGAKGPSLVKYQELGYHVSESSRVVWQNLKDAVLGSDNLFAEIHGKPYYEFLKSDPAYGDLFHEAMRDHSVVVLGKVLEKYRGFEGLNSIVNVAGGDGATLEMIIAKYPSIRGINFDLPEVVQNAPSYQGVEQIGGDMFVEVPKGETMLLKFTLNDWSDERCVDILRNCYKALPEDKPSKVIAIEYMLPDIPSTDVHSRCVSEMYIMSLTLNGAKQRTKAEFEYLAKTAGFSEFKVICYANSMWVMEFIKGKN